MSKPSVSLEIVEAKSRVLALIETMRRRTEDVRKIWHQQRMDVASSILKFGTMPTDCWRITTE